MMSIALIAIVAAITLTAAGFLLWAAFSDSYWVVEEDDEWD